MITVRSPLFGLYVVLGIFLFVGYCAYGWLNWTLLLDRHHQRLQAATSQMRGMAEWVFSHHVAALQMTGARLLEVGAVQNAGLAEPILVDLVAKYPGLAGAGLTAPSGKPTAATGASISATPSIIERGDLVAGRAQYHEHSRHWAIPIHLPLYEGDGVLAGVLSANVSLSEKSTSWGDNPQVPEATEVIVAADGWVRYASGAGDDAKEQLYTERVAPAAMYLLTSAAEGEKARLRQSLLCTDCFVAAEAVDFFGERTYIAILYPFRDIYRFYAATMVVPTVLLITVLLALVIFYRQHTRYESRILRMAQYDSLTNLPNRPFAVDRLASGLRLAKREGWQLALFFIDLDNFKQVNDTYGHHAGDELLREAARRLQANLKSSDTVARLGGDEFLVILQNTKNTANVVHVAHRLLERFAEPVVLGGSEVFLELSIGFATFPEDATDPDELLKRADAAMYVAKGSVRSKVVSYAETAAQSASGDAPPGSDPSPAN